MAASGTGNMSESYKKTVLAGLDKYRQQFIEAMDDDLNTADAISAVFELITAVNTAVREGASKEFAQKCLDLGWNWPLFWGFYSRMYSKEVTEVEPQIQAPDR